jgi:hypothetical protein
VAGQPPNLSPIPHPAKLFPEWGDRAGELDLLEASHMAQVDAQSYTEMPLYPTQRPSLADTTPVTAFASRYHDFCLYARNVAYADRAYVCYARKMPISVRRF